MLLAGGEARHRRGGIGRGPRAGFGGVSGAALRRRSARRLLAAGAPADQQVHAIAGTLRRVRFLPFALPRGHLRRSLPPMRP